MLLRFILLVLLLTACDRTVPTPVGFTLVSVPTIGTASAPFTHHSRKLTFYGPPLEEGPQIEVSFDAAPTTALRDVRIVVIANKRWAMSAHCTEESLRDPATNVPVASATCPITIARDNGKVTVPMLLRISADDDVTSMGPVEWILHRDP